MEPSTNRACLSKILSHLKDGDFTCLSELNISQEQEIKSLFAVVEKYHDLFQNLKNYFRTGDQKIHILSVANRERTESSSNITQANEFIAATAKKQAELSDECITFARDFGKQFQSMLEVSQKFSDECINAQDTSSQSRNHITQYLGESKKTQDFLLHTAAQISTLTENMKKIKNILKLINKISDQTNILAINAHIESVHAGKAGSGFAVIAREVKNLANESKRASNEIYGTVVKLIEEASGLYQNVLSGKDLAESQSKSIASAHAAMGNISTAVSNLIRQQTESAVLIQELNTSNNQMMEKISTIHEEAEKSAATCQVVSDVSSDQYKQNQNFQSGIHALAAFHAEHAKLLADIKVAQTGATEKKIGIICLEQSEFYAEIERAAILAGAERGIQVISGTPANFDVKGQLDAFARFVEQKMDGIILVPGSSNAFMQPIDEAYAQGIPVVCVDADVADSKRAAYITSDNVEGGRLAGQAAAQALGSQGRIYALLCASEVLTVQQRFDGFKQEIRKYEGLEIVKVQTQQGTNRETTKELLQKIVSDASRFDLLYLVTAESGEIAVSLWNKNHLANKMVVLSKSSKLSIAVAQEIVTAQIVQNNKAWGETAVCRLSDLFQGKTIPQIEDTGMREINQSNFVMAGMSAKHV